MPRGPFNTTCDVFHGPRGAIPNALRGSNSCRLVMQNGIMLIGNNKPVRVAWVTMEAVTPVGAWIPPAFSFDPGVADQIAVPQGTAKRFWVLYVDAVIWNGQPLYKRACLAELPIPLVNPEPPTIGNAMITFGSVYNGPYWPPGGASIVFDSEPA